MAPRFAVFAAAAMLGVSDAHICLLNPVQRGGLPGDMGSLAAGADACFQPFKCTQAPGAGPVLSIKGGAGFNVLLQQNLNHYAPGFPGVIEVSFSAAAGDPYVNLATIPDYWPHLQAAQTNFSVPVWIPEVESSLATLRVIYRPNKPTEPEFYNCADVAVTKPDDRPAQPPVVVGFLAASAPVSQSAASVASALSVDAISGVPTVLGSAPAGLQVLDGVGAAVTGTPALAYYALARSLAAAANGSAAQNVVLVDPATPGFVTDHGIHLNDTADAPTGWVALVAVQWPAGVAEKWAAVLGFPPGGSAGSLLALLGLGPSPSAPGKWVYQARLTDAATGYTSGVLATSADQDTFVNFMWATAAVPAPGNPSAARFHFLGGDENSLYALNAAVFTVDLDVNAGAPTVMGSAVLDNSRYTLGSLQVDPADGRVVALSPGLFGNTTWRMVEVDPATGAVTPLGPLIPGAPASSDGVFAPWYGGGVAGGVRDGALYHLLRHALDGSTAVAVVNTTSGALIRAPTMLTGVDSEFRLVAPVLM